MLCRNHFVGPRSAVISLRRGMVRFCVLADRPIVVRLPQARRTPATNSSWHGVKRPLSPPSASHTRPLSTPTAPPTFLSLPSAALHPLLPPSPRSAPHAPRPSPARSPTPSRF